MDTVLVWRDIQGEEILDKSFQFKGTVNAKVLTLVQHSVEVSKQIM